MNNEIKSHSSKRSLAEWLYYLENLHCIEIDLGLTRIGAVANVLNIDLSSSTVITVAGTNGKGTTCAFLENAFLSENKTVAVYSSPHIERFNERLRINKQDVNDTFLIDAFEEIEQARGDVSLTYYEYTTLAALLIVQQKNLDIIILEVGLGGRLDATNIIDADVAVITTIDLDHQSFLGDTRELIGIEKAGIMRANKLAVIGDPDIPHNVVEFANNLAALLTLRDQDYYLKTKYDSWCWQTASFTLENLITPFIPQNNVATALAVLCKLQVALTTDKVNKWITETKVAGRTEFINNNEQTPVLLDVGHNPQAARYLAQYLKNKNYKNITAVIGMLKDKDIANTIKPLLPYINNWFIGTLEGGRAEVAETIGEHINKLSLECAPNIYCFDSISQAYNMAQQQDNETDLVLVFGSFLTVAEIRRFLV